MNWPAEYVTAVIYWAIIVMIPVLIIFPVLRYMHAGSEIKAQEILDCQSPGAAKNYFQMFWRAGLPGEPLDVATLKKLYHRWYGRQWFVLPAILAFIVSLIAGYLEVMSAFSGLCNIDVCASSAPRITMSLIGYPVSINLPIPAMTAIAGALVWVTNDFITRTRRLDFSPSDVHWGSLRIAGAVPIGYGFSYFFNAFSPAGIKPSDSAFAAFVAFAVAAFPLEQSRRLLRRLFLAQSQLLTLPGETDELMKLQGVNNEISTRLAQEDITTITQMAYCDPIRITMRSGLSFNFITDCMNQALAWEYLEDGVDVIRRLGFRGAVELHHLYTQLNSEDERARLAAMEILKTAYQSLNENKGLTENMRFNGNAEQTQETFYFVLEEIANDPFTRYLVSVWE